MLDHTKPVEELAAKVAELPDGTDLENESGLRTLLIGSRDPDKYADVFELAATLAKTNWMELACVVEMINGRRRNPENLLVPLVARATDMVQRFADKDHLSVDERLLLAKLFYNTGLMERMNRNYDSAALLQTQGAIHCLESQGASAAIVALFVAAVENTSHAITKASSASKETRAALSHLTSMERLVRGATDTYPLWMQENAALHIVWAKMMAACGAHTLYNLLDEVSDEEFAAARSTTYPHWKVVMELAELFDMGYNEMVVKKVNDSLQSLTDVKSSSIGNTQLTWKIIGALSLLKLQRRKEALNLLAEVVEHRGLDGGVPIAVAIRCGLEIMGV